MLLFREFGRTILINEYAKGKISIRRKKKPSPVNHYFFQIKDKQWGHVCIPVCAPIHPLAATLF